jgi:hypothetical protein
MRLNVPFIPDDDYVRFLAGLGDALEAVHYSLYDSVVSDARIRLQAVPEQRLAFRLRRLPGVRKYLLANGRFHAPERYRTPEGLAALVRRMDRLKTVGVIDGLIFSDPYLLTAVSDAAPELAAGIEAIPSINFMIDTTPKLVTVMEMIGNTRFRLPGKILLDRSLNRRPTALRYLSAEIRRRWPQIQVELLVNEGCLPACPYRSTHEALIAAVNTGAVIDTYGMNRDLGCMRHLFRTPHRILASPLSAPRTCTAMPSGSMCSKSAVARWGPTIFNAPSPPILPAHTMETCWTCSTPPTGWRTGGCSTTESCPPQWWTG